MKPDIVERLRLVADDPMWADHCELSKHSVTRAADEIESLRSQLKHQCELNDAAAEQAEVAVGAVMIKMLELNDRLAEAEALLREARPCIYLVQDDQIAADIDAFLSNNG